ncbi:uncharacterized protein EI90DRAFT_3016429 [Cantharellus anzutake]|uniref:uncharacterized protein n=1 Tax=Cantharellus anzutake TaxID=1750568 RepID=UPI001907DE8E|nr:uncharacterized protein EI90DRAFT_3016429 [Cantharellus anzutake]KAF8331446.1 hypothetical protein EI90DRAFT_3016429 [Cantharellus anzutake]
MNKFFASLFFLLLLSINSAFAIIGSIEAPKNILRPGHTFTVTFLTHPHIIQNAQYYVIFGLQPGIVPPPGSNVGEIVLTSAQSDLVEGGHSSTGVGSFKISVLLPRTFRTPTKKKEKFVLTAAVFQTVWRSSMEMSPSPRTESTEDVAFNMRRIDGLGVQIARVLCIYYVDEMKLAQRNPRPRTRPQIAPPILPMGIDGERAKTPVAVPLSNAVIAWVGVGLINSGAA